MLCVVGEEVELSNGSRCIDWLRFIIEKSRPQRTWINCIYRTGSWVTYRDDNCKWVVCRWDGGMSVLSMWGMGKNFCPNFLQPFLGAIRTEAGSILQYFASLTKMPTVSFGGGSHLEVPCRGSFVGRVEREGGKTSSDQYLKGLWEFIQCVPWGQAISFPSSAWVKLLLLVINQWNVYQLARFLLMIYDKKVN